VWNRLLAYNIDYDRKTPMVLPSPFELKHTYRFHAPSAMTFESVPRDKKITSKWGTFEMTARALDDGDAIRHLEVVFYTRLDKTRVELDDLEAFRKFHEEVNREYRVWVTMKPVSAEASADRLEHLLALMPHDLPTARTLAKIYMRANRRNDANRVLTRACHYHPDESELWEQRIQATTSPAEEEKLHREPGELSDWASECVDHAGQAS
jgi:predicted Zn-dependent protease